MIKYFFTILILVVLSAGCRKDSNDFVIDDTVIIKEEGDINLLYDEISMPHETFSFQAESGTNLYTASGTEINIPPNIFLTPGSKELLNGELSVEITEASKRGDLFAIDKSMIVEDSLLAGQATILITARAGEQPLEMAEGSAFQIFFPGLSAPAGTVIYTIPQESGSSEWMQDEESFINNFEGGLTVTCGTTGWFNFAVPLNESPYFAGNIHVELAENYKPENTNVYLLVESFNTLVKMVYQQVSGQYSPGYLSNLPVSSPLTIIAISNRTPTTYFYGTVTGSIQSTSIWSLDLNEKSIDEIRQLLDNM